jgi:hypothetical protein
LRRTKWDLVQRIGFRPLSGRPETVRPVRADQPEPNSIPLLLGNSRNNLAK